MSKLGMQFDEIRAVATQYGKYSAEISQLISSLKTSQGQLNSNWEGRGFDEFQMRFEELVPNVESFRDLLEEINQFLNSSANLLEEADQQIASGASK
jgi:WXG100 family type VII secretion target